LSSLPLSPFDAIAENSSSLSKQDSSARSRQGSFDINRPRSSGDGDMLILLSDEVSGDMKDDDEEDVFKFEEDIPFACDDTAILDNVSLISSKFETEKQGLFKYNDHLADPPVLQSIMVRGVDGKPVFKNSFDLQ
jgi:hypothetical protein